MRDLFSKRSMAGEVDSNELAMIREQIVLQGRQLKDLSQSNPTKVGILRDPELFSLISPENAIYNPEPKGLFRARTTLSDHLAQKKRQVSPENLFLCTSTSEGYSWLFKLLCDAGDAIFVPKPGYPLFEHLAVLEHVRTVAYPLEYAHASGWHIDVAELESMLASESGKEIKALIVINPNNPTGSYVRTREREAILALCERHGLALIADEVFFDFPLDEAVERQSFIGEDRVLTFVLDGLSKRLGMPQMKLGWISISGPSGDVRRAQKRLELIADTFLSAGTPVMNALPSLLAQESVFVDNLLGRIRKNYSIYRTILEEEGSPHRVLLCQGGWTTLIESPALLEEEKIAALLLQQKGIVAQPGFFFDIERGVHFAFSLIIPPAWASAWCREYKELFDTLQTQ
ncbi:MAG: pyridoxal phosphate-dependent aminotransferase [Rectinema sp.]